MPFRCAAGPNESGATKASVHARNGLWSLLIGRGARRHGDAASHYCSRRQARVSCHILPRLLRRGAWWRGSAAKSRPRPQSVKHTRAGASESSWKLHVAEVSGRKQERGQRATGRGLGKPMQQRGRPEAADGQFSMWMRRGFAVSEESR
jgi:hypothetical protein